MFSAKKGWWWWGGVQNGLTGSHSNNDCIFHRVDCEVKPPNVLNPPACMWWPTESLSQWCHHSVVIQKTADVKTRFGCSSCTVPFSGRLLTVTLKTNLTGLLWWLRFNLTGRDRLAPPGSPPPTHPDPIIKPSSCFLQGHLETNVLTLRNRSPVLIVK